MKAETSLVYGPSGSGKTSQLFRLCRYLLEKERKNNPKARARLISSDGGGWGPFEKSGYIRKGLVEAFDISHREEALADIRRLGEGYWPINANTQDEEFNSSDRCKTEDWENIPIYVVEGITSIATQWLHHMADQEAGMGFKHSWVIKEGEYTIGGLQEGHYGVVQKEVHKLIVHGFNSIPCKYVLWSALRTKAEDKYTRQMMFGPEVAGNAVTHKVTSWLGTTFYLEQALGEMNGESFKFIKAHFESGTDTESDMPFVAKCRITEDGYPLLKQKFKKGYVPCIAGKQGIEKYFQVEEEIMEQLYG